MNLWNIVNPLTAPKKLGQVAIAPFQGSVNGKPWLQSTARTATGAMIGESPEATGQKFGDPVPSAPSMSASGQGQGMAGFTVPGSGDAAPGTTSQPISFGGQQKQQGQGVSPEVQQAIGMFLGTLPPLVGIGGNKGGGGSNSSPLGGGQVIGPGGAGQLGGGLVNLNPSTPNGTVAGAAPGYVYPGNPVVQN